MLSNEMGDVRLDILTDEWRQHPFIGPDILHLQNGLSVVLNDSCTSYHVGIRHVVTVIRKSRSTLLHWPLNHILSFPLNIFQYFILCVLSVPSRLHRKKGTSRRRVDYQGRRPERFPALELYDAKAAETRLLPLQDTSG